MTLPNLDQTLLSYVYICETLMDYVNLQNYSSFSEKREQIKEVLQQIIELREDMEWELQNQ